MNVTAERIVDDLVRADLLDPGARTRAHEVVESSLRPDSEATSTRGLPRLVEVVAYLGGALVLAAATLFLATEWESLTFGSRVTLLSIATAVLLVAGFVAARVPSGARLLDPAYDVRRRLAGSLISASALTAALLTGHVVDRAVEPTDGLDWVLLSAGAVALVVAWLGYLRAATAVGVLALMGSLLTVVLTVTDEVADNFGSASEGDVTGVLLLATGVLWLTVAELGAFREQAVARVVGAIVALVGAQVPVLDSTHEWLGYLLTAGLVVAGVTVYLARQAWPYLALAVVGVTLVVPEAVSDWTEGSLGVVGGVLVTGVTLLVASFAGYRLRLEAAEEH